MIEVFYLMSTADVPEMLLKSSEITNTKFEGFLWSLGWPVNLQTHSGFNGNIDTYSCRITPYFANINIEVIFKSPYLFKSDYDSRSFSAWSLSKMIPSVGTESSATSLTDENLIRKTRHRSRTVAAVTYSPDSTASTENVELDTVAIIWLEQISNIAQLMPQLAKNVVACVIVHPLIGSNGLYLIRVVNRTGISEDVMMVGPLIDDMIVGEQGLGELTRQTATNITKFVLIAKNSYRRPTAVRRQFIEDICIKHGSSNNGIYLDLLQ